MFKKKDRAQAALVERIRAVEEQLARADSAAAQCADPVLFESTVYEIKYLQTRYAYLMNLARESGIEAKPGARRRREAIWKKSS